jgi:hypothetical protein
MRFDAVTRAITVMHADTLPASPRPTVIGRRLLTSAGVTIVQIGPAGSPPWAVLKVAATAQGKRLLDRETAVLLALHADARLDDWRELIPHPHAHGVLDGHSYRLDSALPGHSVPTPTADCASLLRTAARSIAVLHRNTATIVAGGPELAKDWVDDPIREISRRATASPWIDYRLELLRAELHAALGGRRLVTTWIHGDYWLGNLLFSDRQIATGIVDWEAASPRGLPLHDVFHLLLYTRRLVTGHEVGRLLCEQLDGRGWSSEERDLLDEHWGWLGGVTLSPREAMLLYWLRHAGGHARQQGSRVGYRYRVWEKRNVIPVLAAI